MLALLVLLALAPPPTASPTTAWMRPEALHLTIGMRRSDALGALATAGVKTQKEAGADRVVADISAAQSLTLDFVNERLQSIRFELFLQPAEIHKAFESERAYLREAFGAPRPVSSAWTLIYDSTLPNVMAVVTHPPSQRLATMVVRYYDPAAKKK